MVKKTFSFIGLDLDVYNAFIISNAPHLPDNCHMWPGEAFYSRALLFLGVCLSATALLAAPPARTLPRPLPNHPGNIFLAGEEVSLPVPTNAAGPWKMRDYDGNELPVPPARAGIWNLGVLPAGYYTIHNDGSTTGTVCAVLEPLQSPTPRTSPIDVDVAMSWFYPPDKMAAAANLCALAGMNRVRDRLRWQDLEPRKGEWAGTNEYDAAAQAQASAGLEILQVDHTSPDWAGINQKRFPPDLRDVFYFYREMARRWRGQITAFEPWNEADNPLFGGHTGAEMAALQKAAWFGLKDGNPGVLVGSIPFSLHNRWQLEDFNDNEAWPCFDTFNFHHYVSFDDYPEIYAYFRAKSAGRPLWITEAALPVHWAGDEHLKELNEAGLHQQAERVIETYVGSLYEGSVATFNFILTDYAEGQAQFGLLRPDLTPRPGYLALAAVGRLLADAKPLGYLISLPDTVRGFVFSARPDGQERDVLVAWTVAGETQLNSPADGERVFDCLGRPEPIADRLVLTPSPVFMVLPKGSAQRFQLQVPPPMPEFLQKTPSPVVLQTLWPTDRVSVAWSAYQLSSTNTEKVPLFIYNFSDKPVSGTLRVDTTAGWKANSFEPLKLEPRSRTALDLQLDGRQASLPPLVGQVRLSGDFGSAGQTVLSLRVMPVPVPLRQQSGTPVDAAELAMDWRPNISAGRMNITEQDGGVLFAADMGGGSQWVYPAFMPGAGLHCPTNAIGLGFTITAEDGNARFHVIFNEANGSSYMADLLNAPQPGQAVATGALFANAEWGNWSRPDPERVLNPGQIVSFMVGCNAGTPQVKFLLQQVRWLVP